MKVTIIGCSGSFPGPTSPASCYLLQAEHQGRVWSIVLDLGNGSLGVLQRHIVAAFAQLDVAGAGDSFVEQAAQRRGGEAVFGALDDEGGRADEAELGAGVKTQGL